VRIDRIKNSLESPYEGPYPVSERITDRICKIIVNGEIVNISVDQLKSAFIETVPDEQQGPSCTQPEQIINLKVYPGERISFATLSNRVT